MKMSLTGQMRLEQRMKLAPRMIQSMEVLQLPLLALQEKIEAELSSNPVLELDEEKNEDIYPEETENTDDDTAGQKELVVKEDSDNTEDFERLDSISNDGFEEYFEQAGPYRRAESGESDKKLEAMKNTAAEEESLNEQLLEQWALVEADEKVRQAGELIINYLDDRGYLTVKLAQLQNPEKYGFGLEHLEKALSLVQLLEPAGVGARDTKECLLIQMSQRSEDLSFEIRMVEDHYDCLLENKLPQIAKKMNCPVERVNEAIHRIGKLDISPGLRVGRNENFAISADITIEYDEETDDYVVSLTDAFIPNLRVNGFYSEMARDRKLDTKTRQFLQQNIHSAQWLMDAIAQRKQTLLRVATAIIKHQRDFFDKGQLYLKPLPMQTIADEVGVHIATVSRAVAGKYVQCSRGILPLRGFFSGGTKTDDGDEQSWDAVKAKLQKIIDEEDKSKPLNDDQICEKLKAEGVPKIARRTVAKYRKLLNIPPGRLRKKF